MLPPLPSTAEEPRLPPSLRLLKALVIVLMVTMILGVITVVFVLVTRMPDGRAQFPALPPEIVLPQGARAQAITFGTGWIGVVSQDNRLFIFDANGQLRQSLEIFPNLPSD